jgi:hypothetical protein
MGHADIPLLRPRHVPRAHTSNRRDFITFSTITLILLVSLWVVPIERISFDITDCHACPIHALSKFQPRSLSQEQQHRFLSCFGHALRHVAAIVVYLLHIPVVVLQYTTDCSIPLVYECVFPPWSPDEYSLP